MGDRFYTQQGKTKTSMMKEAKVPRKLKADWVKDINAALQAEIPGLDKLTMDSMKSLLEAIENVKALSV